jgi:uncharacterized protein involved in exopolysaccharide biosynthesis
MDVWDALTSFRRRWRIGIPLLVVSWLTAFAVGSTVATEYTAASAVLVSVTGASRDETSAADPAQVAGEDTSLPLVARTFTNPMRSLAEAVVIVLDSANTRTAMAELGLLDDYEVQQQTSAPLINLEATSSDETLSIATIEELILRVEQGLADRQITFLDQPNPTVEADVLTLPESVTESSGSRTRAIILLAIALTGFTVLMVALLDGLIERRRSRQTRAVEGQSADGSQTSDVSTSPAQDADAVGGGQPVDLPAPAENGSAHGARRHQPSR